MSSDLDHSSYGFLSNIQRKFVFKIYSNMLTMLLIQTIRRIEIDGDGKQTSRPSPLLLGAESDQKTGEGGERWG